MQEPVTKAWTFLRWTRVLGFSGVAIFLAALGIALALCAPTYRLYPGSWELPLSRLDVVGIDSRGRIYTYSRWTHRIQVYSGSGRFVRAWSAILGTFRITRQDTIRGLSGAAVYTYSLDGRLLDKEKYNRYVHHEEFDENAEILDPAGNTYRILPWPAVWPRVEKVSRAGVREVVISQPLWMWLIQVPVPVFFYALFGVALFWTCHFAERRHRGRVGAEAQGQRGTPYLG